MDQCMTCSSNIDVRYFKNYERDGLMCNEYCIAKFCPNCGRPLSKKIKNQKKESDAVNHPSHYADGRKYEPIDVIDDWELGFCLGNVVKYVSRAGRKDDYIQDLNKAKFYLEHEIKSVEEARNGY